jgi:transcriptional regulator with XRE-family HTH domain
MKYFFTTRKFMVSKLTKKVCFNIRNFRRYLGYSRQKLAEKSGVSIHAIAKLEVFKNSPTVSTVEKLAKGLRVSPLRLFEE